MNMSKIVYMWVGLTQNYPKFLFFKILFFNFFLNDQTNFDQRFVKFWRSGLVIVIGRFSGVTV